MVKVVGWFAFYISIACDIYKYVRQIQKLLITKSSADMSSTSWCFACMKDFMAVIACMCLQNYIGAMLAVVGGLLCVFTTYLVIIYKPEGWKFFS